MTVSVLIVDDDAAIRSSMAEFLNMSGFESFASDSARGALDMLEDQAIDIVITDIMMPEMNGLELTDLITRKYKAIDVIVMTGYSADYSYEEAIGKGASDFVFKPVRFEELVLRLKRVIRERRLSSERQQMLEKLERLAITDGLTKLYNSRHFYKQMRIEVDRSNRYKHSLALMLLDIDHFKQYNDRYGHLEGDKVLVKIGQIIKECLRKMDSAYRYGGEEFTIILPETTGKEASAVAPRIQTSLGSVKFYPVPDKAVNITVSIGVTEYCPGENLSSFVQRADKAMYVSKQKGRNRISSLYTQNCDTSVFQKVGKC